MLPATFKCVGVKISPAKIANNFVAKVFQSRILLTTLQTRLQKFHEIVLFVFCILDHGVFHGM